jgi:hypothetical protein
MQSANKELCWDGITKSAGLDPETLRVRNHLADSARKYEWAEVLQILSENCRLVNASRPDGRSRFAPLHQAAHAGASVEVVTKLLELGAFRSLRSSNGKRPVDIARESGHRLIIPFLNPVRQRSVPVRVLSAIQSRFHDVIRGRVQELVEKHALRLPELDVMLEFEKTRILVSCSRYGWRILLLA